MPISEVGYRAWEGQRLSPLLRWYVITRTGVSVAYRSSKLLRRLLFGAWLPILYFGLAFFAISWVADPANASVRSSFLFGVAQEILPRGLSEQLLAHPEIVLPTVWAALFYVYLASVQSIAAMITVAIVGPSLVSRDVRNRSFLLYFSKPIGPWEYILGKVSVIVFFLFVITLFPAVTLYLVSIVFSPPGLTWLSTAHVLFEIILASLVISIPTSMVMLALSASTKHTRIAAFLWMALWIFGEIGYQIMTVRDWADPSGVGSPPGAVIASIREVTTVLTGAVFDVQGEVNAMFVELRALGVDVDQIFRDMHLEHQEPGILTDALRGAAGMQTRPSSVPHALVYVLVVVAGCAFYVHRRVTQPIRL